MDDNRRDSPPESQSDLAEVAGIAQMAKDIIQNTDANEVRVRKGDSEVFVKSASPAGKWEILWRALQILMENLRK